MPQKYFKITIITFIIIIAGFSRLYNITKIKTLIFDEIYYVRDAFSQLKYAYPTTWPEELGMKFGLAEQAQILSNPSYVVHPPFGKWLISIGFLIFPPDNPLAWRFSSIIFGIMSVAILMLLAHKLTKNFVITALSGLFLAVDGVAIVLSRVSILDNFLSFFCLLGVLFFALDYKQISSKYQQDFAAKLSSGSASNNYKIFIFRPYFLLAAVSWGLACGVKWSGLYFIVFFGVISVAYDIYLRYRCRSKKYILESAIQAIINAVLLISTAFISYLATWSGWIFSEGGWMRSWAFQNHKTDFPLTNWAASLWHYHVEMFKWHSTLSSPHPYQAPAWTWPLGLRPTAMYYEEFSKNNSSCVFEECSQSVTPIPNIIVSFGGTLAMLVLLIFLVWRIIRKPSVNRPTALNHKYVFPAVIVLLAFGASWLPWLITLSRSAVFQFYAVIFIPYLAIALALAIKIVLESIYPKQQSAQKPWVIIITAISLIIFIYFLPLYTGQTISKDYWQSHMWFQGWI